MVLHVEVSSSQCHVIVLNNRFFSLAHGGTQHKSVWGWVRVETAGEMEREQRRKKDHIWKLMVTFYVCFLP